MGVNFVLHGVVTEQFVKYVQLVTQKEKNLSKLRKVKTI